MDVSDASDPVLWLKDCTEEKTGRLEPVSDCFLNIKTVKNC